MEALWSIEDEETLISEIERLYHSMVEIPAMESAEKGVAFSSVAAGRSFFGQVRRALLPVHSSDYVESVINSVKTRRKQQQKKRRECRNAHATLTTNVIEAEIATEPESLPIAEADLYSLLDEQLKQAFVAYDDHVARINQYKANISHHKEKISRYEDGLLREEHAKAMTTESIRKLQRQIHEVIDKRIEEKSESNTVVAASTASVAAYHENQSASSGATLAQRNDSPNEGFCTRAVKNEGPGSMVDVKIENSSKSLDTTNVMNKGPSAGVGVKNEIPSHESDSIFAVKNESHTSAGFVMTKVKKESPNTLVFAKNNN